MPRESDVSLREVTRDTLREILRLEVAPHQKGFVATNAISIAQAHFHPEVAWFRGIYAGDEPAGFVMLHDEPAASKYYLWRFMIDHRWQGRGVGRRALALLVDYVRGRPGVTELLTSCVPGEGTPIPFYEKAGFVQTGEVDDGELVLRLDLGADEGRGRV